MKWLKLIEKLNFNSDNDISTQNSLFFKLISAVIITISNTKDIFMFTYSEFYDFPHMLLEEDKLKLKNSFKNTLVPLQFSTCRNISLQNACNEKTNVGYKKHKLRNV